MRLKFEILPTSESEEETGEKLGIFWRIEKWTIN
jgi:hypothetical protein